MADGERKQQSRLTTQCCRLAGKSQAPKPKSQPGKSKNPKTAATTFSSISQFGNLEFAWDLELGAWSFRRFAGAWDLGFLAQTTSPGANHEYCVCNAGLLGWPHYERVLCSDDQFGHGWAPGCAASS